MMRPIFVIRFGIDAGVDDCDLAGTAWLAAPDRVVTCHHSVAFFDTWASLRRPAGAYTLHTEDGAFVAGLTPGVAMPEADVAVLRLAGGANACLPLEVAAGYICESSPWHADGYPALAGRTGFRLSGAIIRIDRRAGTGVWNAHRSRWR
jgi:hypothetical protein